MPFIDGVRYVRRISLEADVEVAIVKKCVRQLLYYGCVTMIDIFLHSNIYATTPAIGTIASDPKMQAECAMYITKSGKEPPSFAKIFALYCSVQPSLRMSDFCVVYAESLTHIDVRRFITFGLIHGFLRRVHRYPVFIDRSSSAPPSLPLQPSRSYQLPTNSPSMTGLNPVMGVPPSTQVGSAERNGGGNGNAGGGNGMLSGSGSSGNMSSKRSLAAKAGQLEKDILRMMDGEHHTDEICTKFLIRYADVESTIQMNANCFAVHK